jgi:DNA ligase (NAD+)
MGDVIPKVVEVVEAENPRRHVAITAPRNCPACDALVIKDGVAHKCSNTLFDCRGQLLEHMVYMTGRMALDIEALGRGRLLDLINNSLITSPVSLFDLRLAETQAHIRTLPGWGDTSVTSMLEQIEACKGLPLDRFIYALGISGIGEATARALAYHFESADAFFSASVSELIKVDGIGKMTANNIRMFFEYWKYNHLANTLKDRIQPSGPAGNVGNQFEGETIVFTGGIEMKRDIAQKMVINRGGKVASSVSSKTTILVVGAEPGETKTNKARELGILMINEDQFMAKLGA